MHIDDYKFGHIKIDGKDYSNDVIIYNDRVDGSWWRKEGHKLSLTDIEKAIDTRPAVLIIGTGADGCMDVPEDVIKKIEANGIKVVVNRTGEAVNEYNGLPDKNSAIAALHLTC